MKVDQQALNQLAEDAFLQMVVQRHGEAGGSVIRSLMSALCEVFRRIDPSECQGAVVIFQQVDASAPAIEGTCSDVTQLDDLRDMTGHRFTLEITASGAHRVWLCDAVDVTALSERAVVYVYEGGAEYFWAGGESKPVPNIYSGSQSLFAIRTFEELRDALAYYRGNFVRTSKCRILNEVWFDDRRLFLKKKPEATIRRSLEQCLLIALRGNADVRPEQNVDESQPIDIRVTFQLSNRVALIEIKWLGKSKNEDGSLATEYTASRAREGAQQLAGYLDSNREYAPREVARGYLAVLDARRQGLTASSETVSSEAGLHYRDKEIEYDPEYHNERSDFEEPLRMFVEPKLS